MVGGIIGARPVRSLKGCGSRSGGAVVRVLALVLIRTRNGTDGIDSEVTRLAHSSNRRA